MKKAIHRLGYYLKRLFGGNIRAAWFCLIGRSVLYRFDIHATEDTVQVRPVSEDSHTQECFFSCSAKGVWPRKKIIFLQSGVPFYEDKKP